VKIFFQRTYNSAHLIHLCNAFDHHTQMSTRHSDHFCT